MERLVAFENKWKAKHAEEMSEIALLWTGPSNWKTLWLIKVDVGNGNIARLPHGRAASLERLHSLGLNFHFPEEN